MSNSKDEKQSVSEVEKLSWGEESQNNFGYQSKEERLEKRGLEDWEMLESMESNDVSIPFWFIAIFVLLLIVAIGLTFPFWGNRPGYERDWFDWGIPAGVAWVVFMSFIIYYFVDLRFVLQKKKEEKLRKAQEASSENA